MVKLHYYYTVFTTEFNISFQSPRTNTCNTCDALKTKIAVAVSDNNEELKQRHEAEYKRHRDLADKGQQLMRDILKTDIPELRVICVDLQQTLPISKPSTSVAYYRQKL